MRTRNRHKTHDHDVLIYSPGSVREPDRGAAGGAGQAAPDSAEGRVGELDAAAGPLLQGAGQQEAAVDARGAHPRARDQHQTSPTERQRRQSVLARVVLGWVGDEGARSAAATYACPAAAAPSSPAYDGSASTAAATDG